ncbi:hypothetical protein PTKIN_Ptkin18bG0134400 [Pterospermum kingtungense]
MTSWKSDIDPSPGDFVVGLAKQSSVQAFIWTNGSVPYWRSGQWSRTRFIGIQQVDSSSYSGMFDMIEDDEHGVVYLKSKPHDNDEQSTFEKLVISSTGHLQLAYWEDQRWNVRWQVPNSPCGVYGTCGPFAVCKASESPICKCLKGFVPNSDEEWSKRNWTGGCRRRSKPACEANTSDQAADRDGIGCLIWTGDIIDMQEFSSGGETFYLRLDPTEFGNGRSREKLIISLTTVSRVITFGILVYRLHRKRSQKIIQNNESIPKDIELEAEIDSSSEILPSYIWRSHLEDQLELPIFDLNSIIMATNNFTLKNKLGQGGFGPVFKGRLLEGQEIAVKRLSRNSGQGTEEFKNEVKLIARLQHRNLVRLLGCCIEMDEKMLVYEYMENRSLDSVLFNKEKSYLLNWQRRFNIICGIARGLLYLHQDSRFRIVHRDLKASNVLLDGEMNPKISDFGMARIFGQDQTEANTKKVVGTYGYMSPEYAMDGLFSTKSDVFSFGVLVLEVVTGKKNRGFYHSNSELNLLGHAWRSWKEGKGQEVMDPAAGDTYHAHEVLRCIQVGLLCVQERAEDRPNMSTVLLMLSSDTATMPQPKTPGFCLGRRNKHETDSSTSKPDESCTVNQVTVTMLDAR